MGAIRFDMKGFAVVLRGNSYSGQLSFVPQQFNKDSIKESVEQIIPHEIPRIPDFESHPDCKVLADRFAFFFAANCTNIIPGGALAEHARLADGCLDIMIARHLSLPDLFQLFSEMDTGNFSKSPHIEYYKTKAFRLDPHRNLDELHAPIGIDGETTNDTTITVQVFNAMLNLFYDPKMQKK